MYQEKWMDMAIELAKRGRVSPNPQVGAVLVENGRCIGEGFHAEYGGKHAERMAIDKACEETGRYRFPNAELYCTLEPCCYSSEEKHQPPCTNAILEAEIPQIYIAHSDPNPQVSGRGIDCLRAKGRMVEVGGRRREAQRLNAGFITRMTLARPLVRLKLAISLDGRIATSSGDSRWISTDRARQMVHQLRSESDAIMVGSGTVVKDNPQLTVRLPASSTQEERERRNPHIIILSSKLDIPSESQVLKEGTTIFHSILASTKVRDTLPHKGVELLEAPLKDNRLDLPFILKELGKKEFNTVLVEGGAKLATSLLKAGQVDECLFYIAGIVLGKGVEAIGDLGVQSLAEDAIRFVESSWEKIDDQQILFRGWTKEAVCLREL